MFYNDENQVLVKFCKIKQMSGTHSHDQSHHNPSLCKNQLASITLSNLCALSFPSSFFSSTQLSLLIEPPLLLHKPPITTTTSHQHEQLRDGSHSQAPPSQVSQFKLNLGESKLTHTQRRGKEVLIQRHTITPLKNHGNI